MDRRDRARAVRLRDARHSPAETRVAEVDEVLHVALGSRMPESQMPRPRAAPLEPRRDLRSHRGGPQGRGRRHPCRHVRGPASNWGLTRTSPRKPGRAHSSTGPRATVREMNDTSAVTNEGENGRRSRVRARAFVRSRTSHPGVAAQTPVEQPVAHIDGATRAAPPRSRRSTKPPVELPRSQTSSPETSMPRAMSA